MPILSIVSCRSAPIVYLKALPTVLLLGWSALLWVGCERDAMIPDEIWYVIISLT